MQNKFQHTFTKSKMNKDLDARLLSNDEYRDGQNISVSRSEADDVGALENILGNSLFSQLTSTITDSSSYLLQFIGWYINNNTNKVYIFATNFQDSSSDQISTFTTPFASNKIICANINNNTISTIVSGRFLNFSYNSPILDTTMIENLLFWTDNRNQPRVINVETAESDPNYYFHEDHISVAKYYPHKTIQLFQEYSQAAMFTTTSAQRTEGYTDFDSLYPYFLFDKNVMSTSMLAALEDNIGLQGYVKGNDNKIWEFKVAYVQTLTSYPTDPFTGGIALAVFIDRDISNQVTAQTDPDGATFNYTVYFVDQNQKDVSSPWLREDQAKLKLETVSSTTAKYTVGAVGNYEYAQSLYKFGTRSPYNYLEDVNGGGTWSPFQQANHFPKNTGDAAIGFPRIKHPNLAPDKYYVITGVDDPGASDKTIQISELSGFSNGTLTTVSSNNTGLNAGDIITVHWPNKFYNYNFPGNSQFLEDKFVRFAYRFKFDDGEYSVISPFTQEVFIPKQKGYFLKEIGRQKSKGASVNNYVPQENIAGENTIVDFMENEVTEIKLRIPCEYAFNTLANNLKVSEIDILYKESMSLSIKVVESIKIDDPSITSNSTNFLDYTYQSQKPIKTLREAETTRVYDNVPIRAKTLSSSGNRIILGNFYDRHTSPKDLSYLVSAGRKLTPGSTSQNPSNNISSNLPSKFSSVTYPNHTLKQNRTYQVGLILQDRYGRSSDVILSKFTDTNFTLQTGSFVNDPQIFSGSTVYHKYFDDVITPQTASGSITSSNKTYAGLVDWPGDSLKILFTEQIPRSISYASGYPGLYEDPLASTTISTSNTTNRFIEIPTGGARDSIQPGDIIEWVASGVKYRAVISYGIAPYPFTSRNRYGIVTEEGEDPSVYPSVSQAVDFITAGNADGWYSYKVVVKQQEQDYYNVYLPSLLDGTPVIKPFELTCVFTSASKIVTVSPIGSIEYLTFPLLEGMKVVIGGNTYYINNILNYEQFELTSNALVNATGSATFSTEASDGVLNVTTLLTDNANKVPPALNETTPVQQQYSTSDVELIPRLARITENILNPTSPLYFQTGDVASGPVFPGLEKLKVQSIGNFENLFKRGSYNGLYNADTDPPTAIIQNKFNIGQNSQSVKPSSEEELLPAIYETTPTKSELEIFYETSTSGTVKELNTLIRDNLNVPTQFVIYPSTGGGTGTAPLGTVNFNESVQYSATATIVKFQLVDQNNNLISYASAENFTVNTAAYQNGTLISTPPFTVTQSAVASEITDSVYLLKPTATNPMYSSRIAGLDSVNFDINFNFLQFGVLPVPYTLNINTRVLNSSPVYNTSRINDPTTTYYVNRGAGINPSPVVVGGSPATWNNDDGTNSTKSRATNGSNSTNVNAGEGIDFSLFVKSDSMFKTTGFINANEVEGLNLSLFTTGDFCLLNFGNSLSNFTLEPISIEIRATDQGGSGLTSKISEFKVKLFDPVS